MNQEELQETIKQLGERLQQRQGQLLNQDPLSQRLIGQVEVYRSLLDSDTSNVSENGELVEEAVE